MEILRGWPATKPAEYYGPLFASEDVFLPRNTSLLETNASVLDGLCGRIAHLCAQISSVPVTTNAIPPLVLIYFIDWLHAFRAQTWYRSRTCDM